MSKKIIAENRKVVVGVDVHTKTNAVAVLWDGQIVHRQTLGAAAGDWAALLSRLPGCEMDIVYETGPTGFNLYDQLIEMAAARGWSIRVHVVAPNQVPRESRKSVKTDARDAKTLARAFWSGALRGVTVPPKAKRHERELVRTREAFRKDARRMKSRIHGLLKFHGIAYPAAPKWSAKWREMVVCGAAEIDENGCLSIALFQKLEQLRTLEQAAEALLGRIRAMSRSAARGGETKKLMAMRGIGEVSAAVISTEVPSFHAFKNSAAFAAYTGLVSGARGSGQVMRLGHITKEGNRRLRRTLIECAWVWVRHDKEAKERFERLAKTRGKRRAIVAMARRLAVKIYHVIVNGAPPAADAAA